MLIKFLFFSFRLLFPDDETLVEDLLYFSRVDGRKRAHQLTMAEYDALCHTFIDLCDRHDLSRTPLKVRQPDPVPDTKGISAHT